MKQNILRFQWKNILVVTLIFVALSCRVFAQEKISAEDKVIGATCRGLLTMFVSLNDFDKLKKENIAKVKKMDDVKFNKKYAKIYPIIKDLPLELVEKYRISENFAKSDALHNMEILDKKEVLRIIDVIPDKFFAEKIKAYFIAAQTRQATNMAENINNLWNQILRKKIHNEMLRQSKD